MLELWKSLVIPWALTWAWAWMLGEQAEDITWQTVWTVNNLLSDWNSLLNPLLEQVPLLSSVPWASTIAWWVSAWFLVNRIMNDVDWFKDRKKLRWVLTALATAWWAIGWTVAAPYLTTWALAYALSKHWWNLSREALKILYGWTVWWIKWLWLWVYNWIKNWMWAWNHRWNPDIS